MIRIHRPVDAPEELRVEGAARRLELETEHDAHASEIADGTHILSFRSDIYAHTTVKDALIAMQHAKCAFCEAKPLHVSYGDVEHFRPKGAVRQSEADALLRPGYYWLAYEWTNLVLSCALCNQRHKRNLFPLADPAKRAQSHRDSIEDEDPVFVDPSREDPAPHIGFNEHVPVGLTPRGERTIEALGLRRHALNEHRRERYSLLLLLRSIAAHPDTSDAMRAEVRGALSRAVTDDAEYARMCQVALASLPATEP